jgi:hypothetical protein
MNNISSNNYYFNNLTNTKPIFDLNNLRISPNNENNISNLNSFFNNSDDKIESTKKKKEKKIDSTKKVKTEKKNSKKQKFTDKSLEPIAAFQQAESSIKNEPPFDLNKIDILLIKDKKTKIFETDTIMI